jgi:hypothetical protein
MGGVQRFGMVAMQLGQQGKQALALVMQELEGKGHEVAALRELYKLWVGASGNESRGGGGGGAGCCKQLIGRGDAEAVCERRIVLSYVDSCAASSPLNLQPPPLMWGATHSKNNAGTMHPAYRVHLARIVFH